MMRAATANSPFPSRYSSLAAHHSCQKEPMYPSLWAGGGEHTGSGDPTACSLAQESIWTVVFNSKSFFRADLFPSEIFLDAECFPRKEKEIPEKHQCPLNFPKLFNEVECTVHLRLGRILVIYIPTKHTQVNYGGISLFRAQKALKKDPKTPQKRLFQIFSSYFVLHCHGGYVYQIWWS